MDLKMVNKLRTEIESAITAIGAKHRVCLKLLKGGSNEGDLTLFQLEARPKAVNYVGVSTLQDKGGHFLITTPDGRYYQRKDKIVAFIEANTGQVYLDRHNWLHEAGYGAGYGITQFLGKSFSMIVKNIGRGVYQLAALNKTQ